METPEIGTLLPPLTYISLREDESVLKGFRANSLVTLDVRLPPDNPNTLSENLRALTLEIIAAVDMASLQGQIVFIVHVYNSIPIIPNLPWFSSVASFIKATYNQNNCACVVWLHDKESSVLYDMATNPYIGSLLALSGLSYRVRFVRSEEGLAKATQEMYQLVTREK